MKALSSAAILVIALSFSDSAFAQKQQSKPQPKKQTTQQSANTSGAITNLSKVNAEIAAGMEKMRTDANPFRQ